jgi:hypothetical protein
MRSRPKLLYIIGTVLALLLVLSACSRAPQTPPPSEFTSGGTEADTGEVAETDNEPADVGTGGEEVTAEDPEQDTTTGGGDVLDLADDVPIPQGAYDANLSSTGNQIVYKVGGLASQVVDFYVSRLSESGWEVAGQDTVVGHTALMTRVKPNGDRLSINMQYNPNADFTVVTLVVTRQ